MAGLKLVSPQAIAVYKLLFERGSLTAREIGENLHIMPNAVYRSCLHLQKLGLVNELKVYPAQFSAVQPNVALPWFLIEARRSFSQTFSNNIATIAKSGPTITFIKNRDDLITRTENDGARAIASMNFIVSHTEVPERSVLAYRKAMQKGARIRVLVQTRTTPRPNKEIAWNEIGAEVKFTEPLGIRLFIFDSNVAYFTSYNESKRDAAFGVRYDYPQLAALMDGLFDSHWALAQH